jgi:hypothetical protein
MECRSKPVGIIFLIEYVLITVGDRIAHWVLAMGWTGKGLDFMSWEGQDYSPLHIIQTNSGARPVSYPMGTGGSFLEGKVAGV